MILPLTARLVAVPELAWPRLAAAYEQGELLPSPMGHAAAVGGLAAAATCIGMLFTPRTVGESLSQGFVSVVAYVGAAALVVALVPQIMSNMLDRDQLERFASAALLPLCASGLMNIIPLIGLSFVWTLAGVVLTTWSAWIGASSFLGLEGVARRKATLLVALPGGFLVLAATFVRFALAH